MSLRWSFGLLSLQGCAFRYTFHDGQSRSKLIESDGQSAPFPRQRIGRAQPKARHRRAVPCRCALHGPDFRWACHWLTVTIRAEWKRIWIGNQEVAIARDHFLNGRHVRPMSGMKRRELFVSFLSPFAPQHLGHCFLWITADPYDIEHDVLVLDQANLPQTFSKRLDERLVIHVGW